MSKSKKENTIFANSLPTIDDPVFSSLLMSEDLSIGDLAKTLPKHPVFFSQCLTIANASAARRGAVVSSAEHLANYLGAARIISAYSDFPKTSIDSANPIFKRILLASRLSFALAHRLSHQGSNTSDAELKYVALHWLQPFWYIAFHEPEKLLNYDSARHNQAWQPTKVQEKLLGMDVIAEYLTSSHIEFINAKLKAAFIETSSRSPRQILRFGREKEFSLSAKERTELKSISLRSNLINNLALEILGATFERRAGRYLSLLAKSFGVDASKILRSTYDCVAEIASEPLAQDQSLLNQYLAIPQKLMNFWPGIKVSMKSQNAHEETANITPANLPSGQAKSQGSPLEPAKVHPKAVTTSSPPPIKRPTVAYTEILSWCHQLASSAGQHSSLKALTRAAFTFFKDMLHFDRCVLISVSRKTQESRGLSAFGCGDNEELAQFQLPLDEFGVLKKFLNQPAFLEFNKKKHEKIWTKLPKFIREDTDLNGFLLSSLASSTPPNLLIYADNRLRQWHFEDALVHAYRQYVKALSQCIYRLNQQVAIKAKKQSVK